MASPAYALEASPSFTSDSPAVEGADAPPPMMRTVSSEGACFAHPKPDLQTAQGAYVGNVERLEEHAERLSQGGSDVGDEIRKLKLEQKLSESRRSSLHFSPTDEPVRSASQRSRNASYSSHQNSIVDVNHAARWGGYSPNAFIGSPAGSINSASWSQVSVQRQRSVSKTSRLGMVTEPAATTNGQDEPIADLPPPYLTEAGANSQSSFADQMRAIAQDIQEQLDGPETQLEQDLLGPAVPPHASPAFSPPSIPPPPVPEHGRPASPASITTLQQADRLFTDFDGVHYAPSSREVSGGTEIDVASRRRSSMLPPLPEAGAANRRLSAMALQPSRDTWAQPPPDSNMVYYPAPVPALLNLPQRLSLRPAPTVQAKRREKMMSMMAPQDREAAPWGDAKQPSNPPDLSEHPANLSPVDKPKAAGNRNTVGAIPPQLRATMFFDAPLTNHEIEVKNESAVVTLDSILEASASAPVGAFTNHPFAGHEGAKVYKRDNARRSTTALMSPTSTESRKSLVTLATNTEQTTKDPGELKKRRSSFGLIFGRRSHSTNELVDAEKLHSPQDSRLTMRTTSGLANLNTEQDSPNVVIGPDGYPVEVEGEGEDFPMRRTSTLGGDLDERGDVQGQDEGQLVDQAEEDEESGEDQYAAPTTLLAELQKRKAQQKSRNRTAATAFPNGMHSTLLELDAVEEMNRKRRVKGRVALAWEDPEIKAQMEAEQDDDDVPLGVLFTNQNGVIRKVDRGDVEANAARAEQDWDRPLGLIAQRELEDNEPLSKRRTRLMGGESAMPTKRSTMNLLANPTRSQLSLPRASQLNLATGTKGNGGSPNTLSPNPEAEDEDDEDDNIPLAQRAQRIRTRKALSMAISEVEGARAPSGEFVGELLSQFGVAEPPVESPAERPPSKSPAATPDPEETLGQRRARLQAQQALERPPISRRTSGSSTQLLNDTRLSTVLPGKSPSPFQAQQGDERPKSGLGINGLRSSRSMADLLAAHPLTANAHTARKVSDDQLMSSMPAGSLLAQNEQLQKRNKMRLSSANALFSGSPGEGPLIGQLGDKGFRQPSGTFGRGLLGEQDRRTSGMPFQQPMMTPPMGGPGYMNMGGMGMGMPMQGYGNMQYPAQSPMSHMSMGYFPQMPPQQIHMQQMQQMQQMQMQMQMMQMQQQYMGNGGMQMGGNPAFSPGAHQGPTTYAAFAQQQMGMAGGHMAGGHPDMNGIKPEQRDMIDRWRQGVT